ncbi:S-layer homology domain-containing protein [Candidatus Peregrinibacteria bacterium]|nr:S-layer homology domain-containing protein [Candidatus Peregrinibacteria bacterium]
MFEDIKKAFVVFSAVALFVVNTQFVFAQTFNDVPVDSWYYNYVEELVQGGVIEFGDEYRPNDNLTRAELAKMIVKAVDGLSDYESPENPTFSDVPANSEYFDYIEAAVQLNIIGGYTDVDDNPTDIFGYNDFVTRDAATKILITAFNIPINTETESIFPDVIKDMWYYDYVVTAFNNGILDGYADGNFGPADPITRSQIAKLIANSKQIDDRESELRNVASDEVIMEENGLIVSLGQSQYPPITVPLLSTGHLINLDLTATDADVLVSEISLTRSGVGASSDWIGIYVYQGMFKITPSEFTISADTNKVTIPLNVFVGAGQTVNIAAYGDVHPYATPTNEHFFSLASASDISSSASSVIGDFPMSGNAVNIGNIYANTITVTPGLTPVAPRRDDYSEIAAFRLEAGSPGDIALRAVMLTQGGTFSSDKMTDCSLLDNGDLISTAEGFYGDKLIFAFPSPYIIKNDQKRNFYVKCYINGGRTTDTIKLYLDSIYDLPTIDMRFGFPATPLNGYTITTSPAINLRGVSVIIQ